jgi:hypothetical protein
MFEALRGLRDAVAPESGNLGGNNNNSSGAQDQSVDALWQRYCQGDEATLDMVRRYNDNKAISKYDDFVKFHERYEFEKDSQLVETLAAAVLDKSHQIDRQVEGLPGMHRTRTQQIKYIETLIEQNSAVMTELEETYQTAKARRDACRAFVHQSTSIALGIVEEK